MIMTRNRLRNNFFNYPGQMELLFFYFPGQMLKIIFYFDQKIRVFFKILFLDTFFKFLFELVRAGVLKILFLDGILKIKKFLLPALTSDFIKLSVAGSYENFLKILDSRKERIK